MTIVLMKASDKHYVDILEKYLRISMEKDDKYYRNYLRNQTLIDFEFVRRYRECNSW